MKQNYFCILMKCCSSVYWIGYFNWLNQYFTKTRIRNWSKQTIMAEDLPDEFDVVVIGTGNVNLYTSKLPLSFVTYNMKYVTIFLTDWSVYGPYDHFNFSYSMSVRYQGRIRYICRSWYNMIWWSWYSTVISEIYS